MLILYLIGCPFIFYIMPFDTEQVLILMKSYLSTFHFVTHASHVTSTNSLPITSPCRFMPFLSSEIFMVLSSLFRPLIHFELISVCSVRKPEIHSLSCKNLAESTLFAKETILSLFEWFWHPCQKWIGHRCMSHQTVLLHVLLAIQGLVTLPYEFENWLFHFYKKKKPLSHW